MKVAVDVLAYKPGETGAVVYWRKMLDLLPTIDPTIHYYFFVTASQEKYYRQGRDDVPNLHFVPARYRENSILGRLYFQEVAVPRFCQLNDIKIHYTCNPVPVFHRLRLIQVWKILGFQYFFFPRQMKLSRSIYWKLACWLKAKNTAAIVANSEYTKKILIHVMGISASKIKIIYEALDHNRFFPSSHDVSPIRKESFKTPYILNISENRPYKRQMELVRAFAQISQRVSAARPYSLVIIGRNWMGYRDSLVRSAKESGIGDKVIFLDYLPNEKLPSLYRNADLFVYLSELESFGIPPLEAMASGVPVIVSDKSAVAEISGGGGWAVDPDDQKSIIQAMETLLTNPIRREEAIQRGLRWAQRYHWRKNAEETVQLFHDLVHADEHKDD